MQEDALTEVAGDIEKAIDGFRKKGVKDSIRPARRQRRPRRRRRSAQDGKSAALVEINSNTDFTAKSEPVLALGAKAAQLLLHNPSADIAQAASVSADVTDVARQTGENVRIGKTAVLTNPAGNVGMYLYGITGKIGVLVQRLRRNATDELIRDLGMHITAVKPLPLARTREELPADIVAKEREFAIEQAKATGKPQHIAEKIAEGKLRTFYEERVLLDQPFFQPDKFKGSVGDCSRRTASRLRSTSGSKSGQ